MELLKKLTEEHIQRYADQIAKELSHSRAGVVNTLRLLAEEATVPFIARYRKEMTGGLDEVGIRTAGERAQDMYELELRKETIIKTIEELGKLTPELLQKIVACDNRAVLEDIYLPYKPKRKTRASIAREKGLEPLADLIQAQEDARPLDELAAPFTNAELGVADAQAAIQGANDILAERVSEHAETRAFLRTRLLEGGEVVSRRRAGDTKDDEAARFKDYFEFSEPASKIPSHRMLAIRRGEKLEHLTYEIALDRRQTVDEVIPRFVTNRSIPAGEAVAAAVGDAYDRLLMPSLQVEVRGLLRLRAEEAAIEVFKANLGSLLLSPPAGALRCMGMDPGFRTGCKVAVIDETGQYLANDTIYPVEPAERVREAEETLINFITRYKIQAIAIGNGTAGRETEKFVRAMLARRGLTEHVRAALVNESGASVYSASDAAREEFPDLDITIRGAISIARRLQDPLSELVKIDPKSIGVGQYQHDVDQRKIGKSLEAVLEDCVNKVGVDLNTASYQLLSHIAGLGPSLAKAIVTHRNSTGSFRSREGLVDVKGLGPRAFEQAAGFLRIRDGENPLDATAVHPEQYPTVEAMAAKLGVTAKDLILNNELVGRIQLEQFVDDQTGLPTLLDIRDELLRPGRDPRAQLTWATFRDDIQTMKDLTPGMQLEGTVTNVTAFGAFVDLGVHQDGLVHISELADNFVQDPHTVVSVGKVVKVTVLSVDMARTRIQLSMRTKAKADPGGAGGQGGGQPARTSSQSAGPKAVHPGLGGLAALKDKFRK
jgi:protein Tex